MHKLRFILAILSLLLCMGCGGTIYMLNPDGYDNWRERKINREIEDVNKQKERFQMFDNWCKQEQSKLEYLIGSTKQNIREKFGKPNKIERKRKFYYKDRAFIAQEVWVYNINDKTSLYPNYNIAFSFENDMVNGITVY